MRKVMLSILLLVILAFVAGCESGGEDREGFELQTQFRVSYIDPPNVHEFSVHSDIVYQTYEECDEVRFNLFEEMQLDEELLRWEEISSSEMEFYFSDHTKYVIIDCLPQ